jgi:hypothetical protein
MLCSHLSRSQLSGCAVLARKVHRCLVPTEGLVLTGSAGNASNERFYLPLIPNTSLSFTKDGCAIAPTLHMPDFDNCPQTKRAPQLLGREVSACVSNVVRRGVPVSHGSKLGISRLPILCLHIIHPLCSDFFRRCQMLIFPSHKIEVWIA